MQLQVRKKNEWREVVVFSEKAMETILEIAHSLFNDTRHFPMRIVDDEGRCIKRFD